MTTWNTSDEPDISLPRGTGWVRALCRGAPLAVLVFGCLALLLLVRLIERPLCGMHRPVTPRITVFVCRNALRLMGIAYDQSGAPMAQHGALVANHASWLDIFTLNAGGALYFVSKSEVAHWPGIGWLARATGTVFIARENRREARAQAQLFESRLQAGHRLLFFPEGTSTDGQQVLTFKTTLFAAFFSDTLRDHTHIQPVSVIYHAPPGESPRFYGWWGDMEFGPHLLHTLAARRHGRIEVIYHAPLAVAEFSDRKALAQAAERAVRAGVQSVQVTRPAL